MTSKIVLCAAVLACLLVIVQSSSDSECARNQTCIRQGAYCEQGGVPCADNLHCVNATCVNTTLGGFCDYPTDCVYLPNYLGRDHLHRMTVDCVNNVCVILGASGDPCSKDSDCMAGLPCTLGVCQGKGENETCHVSVEDDIVIDHFECAWLLSCFPQNTSDQFGFCKPWINDSQPCDTGGFNFNPCGPYSYCRNGFCQPHFSATEGEDCSNFGFGECVPSAYCNADGMCTPLPDFAMECQQDQDCFALGFGNVSACECDNVVGKNFCSPPDHDTAAQGKCTEYLEPLYECMVASQCKSDFYPGTCAWVNCWHQWVNIVSCYTEAMAVFYETCIYVPWFVRTPTPPDNGGGGGSNGGAIAGAIIGSILGVAFLVAVVLAFYKFYWVPRRGYATVGENKGLVTDDGHRYAL